MSTPNSDSSATTKQAAGSAANKPTGAPSTFNYAAAAAKSRQQQQQQQQAAAPANKSAQSSAQATPSDGASRSNTPGVTPNGKPAAASAAPAASSNLNPAADASAAANNGAKRQSAVSMPKTVPGAGNRQGPGGINFGSVHDSSAMLSSSPAVQPKSGEHLQGDKPALFGSVEASNESKQKVVGFASKEGSATTPRPPMDFQKLFQGGGNNKAASPKPAAAPASDNAANESAPAPAPAAQQTAAASPAPASAAAASTPASAPAADAAASASPSAANRPAPSTGALKPPAANSPAPSTPHHPTAQPFEPQRSPSHFHQQGMRAQAAAGAPFHPHGNPQQQPRSPHMPPAPAMQHMMGAHQGHWHGQQQPVYYPAMGGYPYQYAPPPAGHWPQAAQYDMGGAPRSPRHSNVPTSSPMPHPPSSAASMAPSTPGAVSSPASSRAQAVPYSPSTAPSSVSSPPPHGHVGLGHPPGARPPAFHAPSGSYGGHAPSQSFGGAGNPMMSPAARQFEPNPKRMSSAIRIVNPETKATVDVGSPAQSGHKSAASTSAAVTPASPSPAPAAASPATPSHKEASATGSPAPASKKIETAQEFQARVRALAEENKRKKAEQTAAKEKEAAAAEEAKKKAAEEEEERKRKAEADAEAAKKREEEEKAEAARKAAEKEAARKEAERKEQEAKAEAERKEKEAKDAAEAQERAAREKAAAEAAAAERTKAAEESARQEEEKKAVETVDQQAKVAPAPIDTRRAENAKLDAQEAVATGEKGGAEAGKDAASGMTTSRSVADIERMAREASSVPSTPLEGAVGRTPLFPTTPRTPSTPGFAGLPAKPMATLSGTANGTITLDGAQLEKRRRPTQLDTGAAQRTNASSSDAPMSAASMALGSARFIEDLSKVAYPDNVQSPRAELNESAEPGKFKYDRDFLLQFMNVYSEKPQDMPSLASIGMEQGQGVGGGRGAAGRRASGLGSVGASGSGRGGSLGLGIGGGSGFGRGAGAGAMGQFSHPPKTSEERFAQATAGLRGAPGSAFGASGPMGSFNAGSRTQPLSRGGSGSTALPSRDMMGTGAPRTQSRRGKQREPGASSRVNPPEKGGPTIPLDQVVPLARSESRWQAGTGAKLSTDSPEMVQRKVKALLNKLTVEKFASISDQILEWANKSVDEQDGRTLRQVIALIFEKATDEAAWSEMYAQLCRKLMEELSPNVTDESLKGSDGKLVVGGALFRKYLLNRCQEDFERGWAYRDAMVDAAKSKEAEDKAKKESNEKAEADAKAAAERGEKTEAKDAELMSEEYYIAQKAKRRGLGLVRFIGELFKLQMLTERIMHICIKKLLSNATDPEEEEIESLCKLLTTVGRQLDTEKARAHIDIYFQRMTEMSNSPNVNSRMKFMLLDVIELRAAGWKGKQEAAGPKSIAQIHEDAAKQKQQQEAELAARTRGAPPSRGGSRRGQQRGEFGGPGQPVGPDGWTAVGNAPPPPRPTRAGDLSSFGKIERSGSGRPLTLGGPMGGMPNTVFAKKQQKSSEEGSKPPSRTSSSANMFDLLNQAESSEQSAPAEEARRPKLNLAPRTKPIPGADEGGEGAGKAEGDAGGAGKEEEMSEEAASRKIDEDIKEFLEIKDAKEGVLALKSLPSAHRSRFLAKITEVVLNKKEADVRAVGKLLAEARAASPALMDDSALEQGFKDAGISMLDDMSIDVPNVYSFMAILVVASGLPQSEVEKLAELIEGDGLKPPKQRFLEKVAAEREAS